MSPWVEPGLVCNDEYRHASLIATLRKAWDLGQAFTQRDASARTFGHVFTRDTLRDPQAWATFQVQPLPAWTIDYLALGKARQPLRRTHASAHRRSHERGRLLLPSAGAR